MGTETKKNQPVQAITRTESLKTEPKKDNYEPVAWVTIQNKEEKDEGKYFKGIKSNKKST